MNKINDLTNKTFGTLTVLKRVENDKYGRTQWLCKCTCGKEVIKVGSSLTSGNTKSCGDKIHRPSQLKQNLVGQQFGKWTVLQRVENTKAGKAQWLCRCECGTERIHDTNTLTSGRTKSCGCSMTEYIDNSIDIQNQIFGNLKVIKRVGSDKYYHALWECECLLCGNHTIEDGVRLRNGKVLHCGCKAYRSHGELKIIQLLKENNILFEEQKKFKECIFPKTKYPAIFDFWVNNKYIIEYDGQQHFTYTNNSKWNTPEHLQYVTEHDQFKNNWCKENNIPIIRIPYTEYKNLKIEDLLLETSSFRIN